MPNPLSGKDRLIVNPCTQILLIIDKSQLPFTLSKLSTKGQLCGTNGYLIDTKQ